MNKFENIIKNNAQNYYDNGNQTLTDEEFDALVEKVKQDNPNSSVLSTGWGSSIVRDDKIKHKYGHIGSLDKIHSWNDLLSKFSELADFDLSAKLDGISCVIYIKEGNIELALTRGDGEFGIDITDKFKYGVFKNSKIKDRFFTGAVRGELMMSKEKFKKYCDRYYCNINNSNQRNITAGIINRKEWTCDLNYIDFYAYSVVGCENGIINNMIDVEYFLVHNFENIAPRVYSTFFNQYSFESELKERKEEWEKDLYIDGIVISSKDIIVNKAEIKQQSVAYKFDDLAVATTVLGIEWTMSKNGAYIPVVLIEPVTLDGTIVKRVTGFNAKYIKDNNIKKGTIVSVCKKNQIIPQIVNVIKI